MLVMVERFLKAYRGAVRISDRPRLLVKREPVGVDHPAEQSIGPALRQLPLPRGKPDPSRVLSPRPIWETDGATLLSSSILESSWSP